MRRKPSLALAIGLAATLFFVLMSLFSLVYTPYDPEIMDLSARFAAPSASHLLGCDHFGRDMLSRIMTGTRTALFSALASVVTGSAVGILIALAAAFCPPFASAILMRLTDALMAFPTVLSAMTLAAVLGKGLVPSMVAIAMAMVPTFARLSYSMILETREAGHVKAARSYGASKPRLAFVHILPALAGRLVTQLTASIGGAILLESSLSFLGLGIQPPQASLGMMLSEARAYVLTHPWQALPAGIVLCLLVLAFNLLGDALAERFTQGGR